MTLARRVASMLALFVASACRPSTPTPTSDSGSSAESAHRQSSPDAGGHGGLAGIGAIGHGAYLETPAQLAIPSGTAPAMPTGSSPLEREKELVDLLSGRVGPDALPVAPTDPGETFDEWLRSRLSDPSRFAGVVSFSPLEVKGALTQEQLARVIAGARARARGCYRNALGANPDLEGALLLRFEILPNGEVKSVTDAPPPPSSKLLAGNVATSAPLMQCMRNLVRRLVFPASANVAAGTTSASFTAHFEPRVDTARR
jgi:hypothetical protein